MPQCKAILDPVVPHGFKTFILLNCLICLRPGFTAEVALCLVNYVKDLAFFSLDPWSQAWFCFPVVVGPGMKSQPCALRITVLKRQGQKKKKSQFSSLLCRWAALTEGSGCRAWCGWWDKDKGVVALVHIGSIPSKALAQTSFFFFYEKSVFGCSIWDVVPPPGIEPSCSGSTES